MRIPTSPTALSLEDRCGPEAARICGLVILHLQKKKKKKKKKHEFLRTGDDCVQKYPGGLPAGRREYVALGDEV